MMVAEYPTLKALKDRGKSIPLHKMFEYIELYWGETAPADDYLALEIALTELNKERNK